MSNEPKKHHYIPQSYLKGFQIDATRKNPKICVYEKENLNRFDADTLEKLSLELIAGIGIDKL